MYYKTTVRRRVVGCHRPVFAKRSWSPNRYPIITIFNGDIFASGNRIRHASVYSSRSKGYLF